MTTSNWHTNPRTIIAIVAFIFGLGVAWTNQSFKVSALEAVIKKHESVPDRLLKLEIETGYIRRDVAEIKGIVQQNARNLNGYIERERTRRNGTSN